MESGEKRTVESFSLVVRLWVASDGIEICKPQYAIQIREKRTVIFFHYQRGFCSGDHTENPNVLCEGLRNVVSWRT